MIGDSITDAGRSEGGEAAPWGESGFGNGYVNLVASHIDALYPEKEIRIFNRGVSGDTIRDLESRWKKDVLDLTPDCLSIFIGINDVWRQCDTPLATDSHVTLDCYEKTYKKLLEQLSPSLKKLILIKPYIIENNKSDRMRKLTDTYGEIVEQLATSHHALLIDPQSAFDAYLEHRHSSCMAWDRIHPNTTGHLLIAREIMKTIELDH